MMQIISLRAAWNRLISQRLFRFFTYCSLKKRKKMARVDSHDGKLKNDINGAEY